MEPTLPISKETHASKYRSQGETFKECCNRIANELKDDDEHYHKFRGILLDMRFLPAGRVQAAMGSSKKVTAFNCFVSGSIADSFVEGDGNIMQRATEAAATMRMGGGIGYDFSTLRPSGDLIRSLESSASGPVSFMDIYNSICKTIASAGHRRGAQMGVLRVDHPDIEAFIYSKQNSDKLTGFNISIAVTDEFMKAVEDGTDFDLKWEGRTYRTIDARNLFEKIMRSTWDYAEPGVLFIDTINKKNNLYYCETIAATNPCFTGDTQVLTASGARNFSDLVGEDAEVMTRTGDGELKICSMQNIRLTQRDAQLVRVTFSNGKSIRCTPEHTFHLLNGDKIQALDLTKNDELDIYHRFIRVVRVESLSEVEDVYCGTVVDTGRFFIHIGDGGGVLVSNCAEQPLPPFGACLLGSFNLTAYIKEASKHEIFNDLIQYKFDWTQLRRDIPVVVRAMDNVTDRTTFPLKAQRKEAENKRRMGLGITGTANAGEAMGYVYGSSAFVNFEGKVLRAINEGCYRASAELAKEKGPFPLFDKEKFLRSGFVRTSLSQRTKEAIKKNGIRNSHLTSIAPTGTISLCANNISSGIEPVFSLSMKRTIIGPSGPVIESIDDYGARVFGIRGKVSSKCTADDHLSVLIEAYKWVDSAVSKTCNVSPIMPWEDFKQLYIRAWRNGCKGCTVFNPGGERVGILQEDDEGIEACFIDPVTGSNTCE